MIKNLKGCVMSKKLKNTKVYVRHFAGAKVRCMKDYIKPSLIENLITLCFTYLDSDRPPDLIAKLIVDVASSVKNEKHVTISNIITRAHNFKEKAKEVNHYLLKLCMERNIYLINPSET